MPDLAARRGEAPAAARGIEVGAEQARAPSVTGKLDVREAAAKLPESPEPELADDEALDAEGDDDASQDEAIAEDAAA